MKNLSNNLLSDLIKRNAAIRTVLDLMPSPLIFWRSDRSFCFLNKRVKHLTGLADDHLEDNPSIWVNRIHPQDRSLYVTAWKKLQEGEKVVSCDYRFSTNQRAKEIWLRDESVPYQNPRGIVEGILSTYTDISDLKANLSSSEKKKIEVNVAGIINSTVHEIQNNLQVMRLELDLPVQDRTAVRDYLRIVNGIEQINKVLREVSEYFTPPELRFSIENPERVLEDFVRHMEKELITPGIAIRLVCRSPLPMVRLDLVQFRKALERIVEFSCALLIRGGEIEIKAGPAQIDGERYVELNIISLSATFLEVEEKDVFRPFLRFNRYQVGLSITLARNVVRRHQGKVLFRKENAQRGLFTVLLKVHSN